MKQFAINTTRQVSAKIGHHVSRQGRISKFHLYKLQVLQELGDDDPGRPIQFCELMTEKILVEPTLKKY